MKTSLISIDAFVTIGLLCAMESLYSQDESIKNFNNDKSYKYLWNKLSFEPHNKALRVNFHEICTTLSGVKIRLSVFKVQKYHLCSKALSIRC